MNPPDTLVTGSHHQPEQNTGKTKDSDSEICRQQATALNRANYVQGRVQAAIWKILAVLTCPCCIPLWLLLLSGTAAGALLSKNIWLTVILFLMLFVFCYWKALRSYDRKPDSSP